MKSLVDFIMESKNSERQEIRIEISDIKGAEDFISELKSALDNSSIYNEKIDKGIKFAIDGEDRDKYRDILSKLQSYAENVEDKDSIKGLLSNISKLDSWVNAPSEDEEKEKEKKEEE